MVQFWPPWKVSLPLSKRVSEVPSKEGLGVQGAEPAVLAGAESMAMVGELVAKVRARFSVSYTLGSGVVPVLPATTA